MKGAGLIVSILTYSALSLTLLMVALDFYPSWSQYARSLYEPLLFGAIGAMMSIFLIRSFTLPDTHLFKVFKIDVSTKDLDRYTGFFFWGIICTPVTHPEWYIQALHFAFTGLAILACYTNILYYRDFNGYWIGASVLGIGLFVWSFIGAPFSLGLGELFAAIPISIHVLKTNK